MQARAVGSKAVCDHGDRAAQPPLDNCFCANSARRLWTATSLVVTMALLYCRLLILSNFGRKTLCHQAHPPSPRNRSRSFARANERAYRISRRELSPPKTRMAEISWRVLTRCDYGRRRGQGHHPRCIRQRNFLFARHDPPCVATEGEGPHSICTRPRFFLTFDPADISGELPPYGELRERSYGPANDGGIPGARRCDSQGVEGAQGEPVRAEHNAEHVVVAHIGRILKNMPHGLTGPGGLTSGSWRTSLVKSKADFGKTTAVSTDPREDLLDNSRLFSNGFKSRLTFAFANRNVTISEWCTRHHVERTALGCMLFTPPTPFHDLGSFIFGNDTLHLEQEVIFRTLAERPV